MSLLLIAHGSSDARHREAMSLLADRVTATSGHDVTLGFLEHDQPIVTDILATPPSTTLGSNPLRTVGLFLSDGYHARVDVPAVLDGATVPVIDCGTLGMGTWLLSALDEALSCRGVDHSDQSGVVLVAAGSTRPEARDEVLALAAAWQRQRQAPVRAAFVSGAGPTVDEALRMLTDAGSTHIAMVTLMLAPGVLADRVQDMARERGLPATDALLSPGADWSAATIVTRILDCAGTSGH